MSEEETPNSAEGQKLSKGLGFAIDFGPMLVFFVAYNVGGAMIGTASFMIAITTAIIISKWKLGKIAPIHWLSAILVLGFGSLTLYFDSFSFIQHKATAVYLLFAIILIISWFLRKPGIKYLMEQAFEGVDEAGWQKLTLRWSIFFAFLAALNEGMIVWLSESNYVTVKFAGITVLILIFSMTQIPMLIRHGLKLEDTTENEAP